MDAAIRQVKVEKRKYYSHYYWRAIFPLLLCILLAGLLVFVKKYPALEDMQRTIVNGANTAAKNASQALRSVLAATTSAAPK